ncbi:MAG: AAA family ATPase [Gemmatimonadaceae bacterium]
MTQTIRPLAAAKAEAPDDEKRESGVDLPPSQQALRFLSDVEIQDLPPLEWLVRDIVPENACVTGYGPPESAKTFFAMSLALSIATGRDFAGATVMRQGPVVYVAAEGSAGIAARVTAWKSLHGVSGLAGVHFLTEPVNLLLTARVGDFLTALSEHKIQPVLIVLDTLARCMVGADENSARDMGLAVDAMDFIRRTTNATVFALHHTRRDSESERGSTALRGAADAMIALKRDGQRLSVSCAKMKDAKHFKSFTLDLVPSEDSCALVTANTPWQYPSSELTEKDLEALVALAETKPTAGVSTTTWLATSELKERTFYRCRSRLITMRYVDRRAGPLGDVYSVTPEGDKVLTANCQSTAKVLPGSTGQGTASHPLSLEGWQHGSTDSVADREYASAERLAIQEDS